MNGTYHKLLDRELFNHLHSLRVLIEHALEGVVVVIVHLLQHVIDVLLHAVASDGLDQAKGEHECSVFFVHPEVETDGAEVDARADKLIEVLGGVLDLEKSEVVESVIRHSLMLDISKGCIQS